MSGARPTRRSVLAGAAALAATAPLQGLRAAASPWRLGAQSYSFRRFSVPEAIARLKALGLRQMEFYSGHFPPAAGDPKTREAKELIAREKIDVPAFGVVGFDADEQKSRAIFEFARDFGIRSLSADPAAESLDHLDRLTEEFGVLIAIHNHGPGHRYATLDDLRGALEGRSRRIGVCLDTGHALRSAQKPEDMARALGERVHSVHLKDWVVGGDEQVLGEGDLDLEAVASALRDIGFSGPLSLEYELQPGDPVAGMRRGLTNWRRALA